jgi:endonuclease YncB( thermonuclease family)
MGQPRCFLVRIFSLIAVGVLVSALAAPARAGNILSGYTYVIDGDTIDVGGRRVRINGIAAPEVSERGGAAAKAVMSRLVVGGAVTCQQVDTDRYGRAVGICSVNGRDIGAAMVASGAARDCPRYSGGRYRSHETDASRRLPLPGYCRR